MLKWLWLSLIILILDQLTKGLATAQLTMFQPVPVFPMLNMTLMHNEGAAFSFLSDAGGWQRWFFTKAIEARRKVYRIISSAYFRRCRRQFD